MAGNYKLSVDLGPIFATNQAIASAVFPLVGQAVRAVAEEGAYRWKDAVWKARLWRDGEKEPYVESIRWQMVGPMSAEITTDFPLAGEIETGRPAKDLKRMLLTSKKTRQTKDGRKYLIIPFRHNTPSESGEVAHAPQMPPDIYAKAINLKASQVLSPGSVKPSTRLSASGHTVAQHSYAWGGRLPAGLAPKLKMEHATDPYAGMVRFNTSTPAKGLGQKAAHSSAYLTFRVMSSSSSGWVVPARPGLYLAQKVADSLQPILDDAVGQAVTLKSLKL
jgi:hypothetical protein